MTKLDRLLTPLPESDQRIIRGKPKYFCRNAQNLAYFRALDRIFGFRDTSYIRRLRLFNVLKLICYATDKKLKECEREDVNSIVGFAFTRLPSPTSKHDFVKDLKFIWKNLFPEKDERGRVDETLIPYSVRHLSAKIDRSKQQLRNDRLTMEEFEKLVQSFSQDKRMQAFLTLAFESLGRPQELLYVKIKDVELHDNFGKVWVTDHGKEGPGFLQCIDSFPQVASWYNEHPLRHNPDAYFFINIGNTGKFRQLKPESINKHIREKLKLVSIDKRITCYSLKRNGVTFRRLRGDSDVSIQHAARWTSTKQLRAYDLSEPDDSFKKELAKRGLIDDGKYKDFQPTAKQCQFCAYTNGLNDKICGQCKRLLDRKKLLALNESGGQELETERKERKKLGAELEALKGEFSQINRLMNTVLKKNPEMLDKLADDIGHSSAQ